MSALALINTRQTEQPSSLKVAQLLLARLTNGLSFIEGHTKSGVHLDTKRKEASLRWPEISLNDPQPWVYAELFREDKKVPCPCPHCSQNWRETLITPYYVAVVLIAARRSKGTKAGYFVLEAALAEHNPS